MSDWSDLCEMMGFDDEDGYEIDLGDFDPECVEANELARIAKFEDLEYWEEQAWELEQRKEQERLQKAEQARLQKAEQERLQREEQERLQKAEQKRLQKEEPFIDGYRTKHTVLSAEEEQWYIKNVLMNNLTY